MTARSLAAAAAVFAAATAAAADSAATQLAHLLVPKDAWSQGIDGLGQQVQSQLQMHPGGKLEYPADFPKTVRGELEKAFPYEEMAAIHAKELSAAYSEAELGQLLGFYKSPIGQKWLKSSGDVQNKVGDATQARIQSKMPDVMTRLAGFAKTPAASSGAEGGLHMPPGTATPATPATPEPKKADPAKK